MDTTCKEQIRQILLESNPFHSRKIEYPIMFSLLRANQRHVVDFLRAPVPDRQLLLEFRALCIRSIEERIRSPLEAPYLYEVYMYRRLLLPLQSLARHHDDFGDLMLLVESAKEALDGSLLLRPIDVYEIARKKNIPIRIQLQPQDFAMAARHCRINVMKEYWTHTATPEEKSNYLDTHSDALIAYWAMVLEGRELGFQHWMSKRHYRQFYDRRYTTYENLFLALDEGGRVTPEAVAHVLGKVSCPRKIVSVAIREKFWSIDHPLSVGAWLLLLRHYEEPGFVQHNLERLMLDQVDNILWHSKIVQIVRCYNRHLDVEDCLKLMDVMLSKAVEYDSAYLVGQVVSLWRASDYGSDILRLTENIDTLMSRVFDDESSNNIKIGFLAHVFVSLHESVYLRRYIKTILKRGENGDLNDRYTLVMNHMARTMPFGTYRKIRDAIDSTVFSSSDTTAHDGV